MRLQDTDPTSFGAYRDEVEGMMEFGEPFGNIEDGINSASLGEDEKAALWLLAWSLRDPAAQRRDARATLELVTRG
jgi:hypothetical protein